MLVRVVRNIKMVIFIRFLLGVGRIPRKSPFLSLFSKIYSLTIAFTAVCFIIFFSILPSIVKYTYSLEYLVFVMISVQTGDKYIYKFCKPIDGIDNLPGANKLFRRLGLILKSIIFLMVVLLMFGLYCLSFTNTNKSFIEGLKTRLGTAIIGSSADLFKLTNFTVFLLFYCRIILLRKSLVSTLKSHENKFCLKMYTQKYVTIIKSLKEIDHTVKLIVSIFRLNSI